MTFHNEKSNNHTSVAKNSVIILIITFLGGLFFTQVSQAASLIGDDTDWAMFGGLMSEYSEFGDSEQVLLAEGHVGVQFTDPYQGLGLALYAKSSVSEFTPIGGTYYAGGITVEYLYQPGMAGFFSGGANLGLSSTYQEQASSSTESTTTEVEVPAEATTTETTASDTEPKMEFGDIALHTELFGRYRITVNNWLQAGAQAGYRLAPNHSPTDQEMKGFTLALFFNFGNF